MCCSQMVLIILITWYRYLRQPGTLYLARARGLCSCNDLPHQQCLRHNHPATMAAGRGAAGRTLLWPASTLANTLAYTHTPGNRDRTQDAAQLGGHEYGNYVMQTLVSHAMKACDVPAPARGAAQCSVHTTDAHRHASVIHHLPMRPGVGLCCPAQD